jgi:hypothetical protein
MASLFTNITTFEKRKKNIHEKQGIRSPVFYCAHDGPGRKINYYKDLRAFVCAPCAARNSTESELRDPHSNFGIGQN